MKTIISFIIFLCGITAFSQLPTDTYYDIKNRGFSVWVHHQSLINHPDTITIPKWEGYHYICAGDSVQIRYVKSGNSTISYPVYVNGVLCAYAKYNSKDYKRYFTIKIPNTPIVSISIPDHGLAWEIPLHLWLPRYKSDPSTEIATPILSLDSDSLKSTRAKYDWMSIGYYTGFYPKVYHETKRWNLNRIDLYRNNVKISEFRDSTINTLVSILGDPQPGNYHVTETKYVRFVGYLPSDISVDSIMPRCTSPKSNTITIYDVPTDIQSAYLGKVTIYPNPVKNVLNVEYDGDYVIIDQTGKVVIKSSSTSVDVSNLKPGLYFVMIGNDLYKILKQ